jgi:hypothetical protein
MTEPFPTDDPSEAAPSEAILWNMEQLLLEMDILGDRLWLVSLAFFVVFLTAVSGTLFPLKVMDPAWQRSLVASLINFGGFPLLGLALLHVAALFSPANRRLQARRDGLARLAILAALGYLLLLPLLGQAVWRGYSQAAIQVQLQGQQAQEQLSSLKQAVAAATSGRDLQQRLAALKGPTLTDADLQRPLPELKQQLSAALDQAGRTAAAQRQRVTPRSPLTMTWDFTRVAAGSLALALGFASLSQRRGSPLSLLQEWLARGSRRHQRPMAGRRQLEEVQSFAERIRDEDD